MAEAFGDGGQDPVAAFGGKGLADAAGHDPGGVDALAGEPFDDLLAELAQADAVAGDSGVGFGYAEEVALGGVANPCRAASRARRDRRS